MDFKEQLIAEAKKLLIKDLQMLEVHAGGMVGKIPQTIHPYINLQCKVYLPSSTFKVKNTNSA